MHFSAFSVCKFAYENKAFPSGKIRCIDKHLMDVSVLSANPKFACTVERIIQKTLRILGRREFNSTLHQSSHGFATSIHGFATKTKALAREIPPAMQAILFIKLKTENLTAKLQNLNQNSTFSSVSLIGH